MGGDCRHDCDGDAGVDRFRRDVGVSDVVESEGYGDDDAVV